MTGPLSYPRGPNSNYPIKSTLISLEALKMRPTTQTKRNTGSFVILEKDPATGVEGELWYLSNYSAGLPQWTQLSDGGSQTIRYPITPYVVSLDPENAKYQTIQSAITAAGLAEGGTVYIMPGSYGENLTMFPNVSLVGAVSPNSTGLNSVSITGQHLPPSAGDMAVQNINFINPSGDAFYTANANLTGNIYIDSCTFEINGFIINAANWITGTWTINNCRDVLSTSNGIASIQSGVTLYITNSNIGTDSTLLAFDFPTINISSSIIGCNLSILEGSTLVMNSTVLNGNIVDDGASSIYIANSTISSDGSAAITHDADSPMELTNVTIDTDNNPAIDGTGTGIIDLSNVTFLDSSTIATTLTVSGGLTTAGTFRTVNESTALTITDNNITASGSSANVAVNITAKGSGKIVQTTTNANIDMITGSGKVNINNAFVLPAVDGSANNVLTTNGSGVTSWGPNIPPTNGTVYSMGFLNTDGTTYFTNNYTVANTGTGTCRVTLSPAPPTTSWIPVVSLGGTSGDTFARVTGFTQGSYFFDVETGSSGGVGNEDFTFLVGMVP